MGQVQLAETESNKTPLVTTQLADAEFEAIARSLLGVPNPDLSMFIHRDLSRISYYAGEHLKEVISRHRPGLEEHITPHIGPILNLLDNFPNHIISTADIIHAFKTDEAKIKALVSIGDHEKAKKIAQDSITSDRIHYSLETILGFHQIAEGRDLLPQEVQSISNDFLLKSRSFDSLLQYWQAHKDRNLEIRLERIDDTIKAVIKAAETGMYVAVQGRKDPEKRHRDRERVAEAFREIIGILVSKKLTYVDLVASSLNSGNTLTAQYLANFVLAKYRSTDKELKRRLIDLCAKFMQGGIYSTPKRMHDRFGIPFDSDACFDAFVGYSTRQTNISTLLDERHRDIPLNMVTVILDSEDKLKDYLQRVTDLIDSNHLRLMRKPERFNNSHFNLIYQFAIAIHDQLGNAQEATRLSRLYRNIIEKAYRMKPLPFIPPEKIEQPKRYNLSEIFLQDPEYVTSVTKAYEENGLFGIRDVTREWAKRVNRDEIGSLYGSSPIEIIVELFHRRGFQIHPRPITEEKPPEEVVKARQRILEYQLMTGDIEYGTSFAIYCDFSSGRLDIDNPGRLALGFISSPDPFRSSCLNLELQIKLGERFEELIPSARIPELLYRRTAVAALNEYAWEWTNFSPCKPGEKPSDAGSWTAALKCYRKIGDPGLIKFVERNLGTF